MYEYEKSREEYCQECIAYDEDYYVENGKIIFLCFGCPFCPTDDPEEEWEEDY